MKVAIVGSRDYGDYPMTFRMYREYIRDVVDYLDARDYIITGGATGADSWAEFYAKDCKVGRIVHEPQWGMYGKNAGAIRNQLIVDDADVLFAFYSNKSKSRGTIISVNMAKKKGIPVFEYDASQEKEPSWINNWQSTYADWYEAGVK